MPVTGQGDWPRMTATRCGHPLHNYSPEQMRHDRPQRLFDRPDLHCRPIPRFQLRRRPRRQTRDECRGERWALFAQQGDDIDDGMQKGGLASRSGILTVLAADLAVSFSCTMHYPPPWQCQLQRTLLDSYKFVACPSLTSNASPL